MVNSSLTFELLLYLNSFYFGMFALCEFGLGMFKAVNFPYPVGNLVSELLLLVFLCCTETSRLILASKGNLTERASSIIMSVALTVPSVLAVVYLLVWQTYILRLEVLLCGIQLTLQALEVACAMLCIVSFGRGPYR